MLPIMFTASHLKAKGIRTLPLLQDPHDPLFTCLKTGLTIFKFILFLTISSLGFCGPNYKGRKEHVKTTPFLERREVWETSEKQQDLISTSSIYINRYMHHDSTTLSGWIFLPLYEAGVMVKNIVKTCLISYNYNHYLSLYYRHKQ